jgi:hypothetical protein
MIAGHVVQPRRVRFLFLFLFLECSSSRPLPTDADRRAARETRCASSPLISVQTSGRIGGIRSGG